MQTTTRPPRRSTFLLLGSLLLGFVLIMALALIGAVSGGQNVIGLLIPAFLAGVLSFLSPCTLPVLPAYFAWTFGINSGSTDDPAVKQRRVFISSLAFFAGLATTMIALGVTFSTFIGPIFGRNRLLMTQIGGVIIIIMGILSLFGLGFAGPAIKRRRSATLGSAYLYGLTFAIGWTACIGPILGSILVMLVSSGSSAIAGGTLTLVYVLGLGLPLILVATFFSRLGQGSTGWRWLRGRAWEVKLGSRTLLLHSTNLLSGALLILVGVLLFRDQLSQLNRYALPGGVTEWANQIQNGIQHFFTGQ